MHPLRLLTLSLVYATVALPFLASATWANTISIGSSILQPCVPTDVPITLESGDGGIGFDIDVTFDPEVVSISSVDLGAATADCAPPEANIVVPGLLSLGIACTEPVTSPGVLAIVHFSPIGNASTALTFTECLVDEVACTGQNGTFSVACPSTPTPTQTATPTPTPLCTDSDSDGLCNAADNCPYTSNPDQLDRGGIGTGSPADGIGDVCQCGDVSGDGRVLTGDSTIILRSLLNPPTATQTNPQLCDVGGSTGCFTADATIILRRLLNPPTATILQNCPPAIPPLP